LARGVDVYTISHLHGHTDIKTTMIYAKMNPELLQSAVNKLEKDGKILVHFLPEKTKGQ
jgi:site-specific recombinase XerD